MGEQARLYELDKPVEECGVLGIIAPGSEHIGNTVLNGLESLQHRGQDAAGIALLNSDGYHITVGEGLLSKAFPDNTYVPDQNNPSIRQPIDALLPDATIGVGHLRYSTDQEEGLQPLAGNGYVLAHNGHIANAVEIADYFGFGADEFSTDTDCIRRALDELVQESGDVLSSVMQLAPHIQGAYSLVISDGQRLVGVRDPNGLRPLSIGEFEHSNGHVLASETPTFSYVGASHKRDVEPGEIVVSDGTSPLQSLMLPSKIHEKMCGLEYAYFAREDAELRGVNVYESRVRMGKELFHLDSKSTDEAVHRALSADYVVGVPDSGMAAAEGYALASGIPFRSRGIVKNRYLESRTFIMDKQVDRDGAVRRKFQINPAIIEDKRLVVVDDSIVRGTTTKALIRFLREYGAAEIHFRSAFPPITGACYYGINIPDPADLLAYQKSMQHMAEILGVDSLAFNSPSSFESAVGRVGKLCLACVDGAYPTEVPARIRML